MKELKLPLLRELKKPFMRLQLGQRWQNYLMMGRGKEDIINHLGQQKEAPRYLEFCTTTTGHKFASIDRALFGDVQRVLYNCPADFDDGMNVTHRTEGFDVTDIFAALSTQNQRPDVILVDSYHTYDMTMRDLKVAYSLLVDGGAIVVHDCLPNDPAISTPDFIKGAWCGVTYKAFIDFVLTCEDCDYVTLDCDYGCGVIVKNRRIMLGTGALAIKRHLPGKLRRAWGALGTDYDAAFALLHSNKGVLLRLTAPRWFFRGFKTAMRR